MKRIKKSFENLEKVSDSICRVPFSTGSFVCTFKDESLKTVTLESRGRSSIGSAIIGFIPSNYTWCVSVEDGSLRLTIWCN